MIFSRSGFSAPTQQTATADSPASAALRQAHSLNPILQITVTKDVDDSATQYLVSELSKVGASVEQKELLHKALSEAPSFVTILAELVSWKALLAVPVTVFISQLAKNAADNTYGNRKKIADALRENAVRPLWVLARGLFRIHRHSDRRPRLYVGLPVPDDFRGTTLALKAKSEDHLAIELALFVSRLDDIQAALQNEVPRTGKPFGGVVIESHDSGEFVLRWCGEDGEPKQFSIAPRTL